MTLAFSRMGQLAARRRVPGAGRLLARSYARAKTWPDPTTCTTTAGDRFRVDFTSYLEWQLWLRGGYEAEIGRLFDELVRPGDAVVDVGANVGIHTLRLARLVGTTGSVVAVEAAPDLAARLVENLSLNDIQHVVVRCVAATAGDVGTVVLHRPPPEASNAGRSSLLAKPSLIGAAEEVPAAQLDDLLAARPVRLVKVDVEGAELGVLAGASQVLAEDRPYVVVEIDTEQSSGDQLVDLLHRAGYDLKIIGRAGLQPVRTIPPGDVVEVLAAPVERLPLPGM